MTFADFQIGEPFFLDANTLVYHFQPHPTLGTICSQLVSRVQNQELAGFTSTHILSEVAHRMMVIEALSLPGWNPKKVKQQLQKQPGAFQQLTAFQKAIETVLNSRIQVLTVAPDLVLAATTISRTAGLLSNDALTVAVMQQHGLTRLASHDNDFDRVPGLIRYSPV